MVGVVITLEVSNSETRDVTRVGAVRLDLAPVTVLLSKIEELDMGFLGTVTSGKLPKVKEKSTVASIWTVMLVEMTTSALAAIELDV